MGYVYLVWETHYVNTYDIDDYEEEVLVGVFASEGRANEACNKNTRICRVEKCKITY